MHSLDHNVDVDGHVTFGGLHGRSQPKQNPAVERELLVTIEEMHNGSIKKMNIARKVRKILTVQLKSK